MKYLKVLFLSLAIFTSHVLSANLLEMYRGSVQEKMLDAQIKAYKPFAQRNAQTFGRDFKHLPNYDRHVGLEKLRKVVPNGSSKDNIPEWRTKAGSKQPHPKLNDLSKIKKSAYK
jgi:hypothetical protein